MNESLKNIYGRSSVRSYKSEKLPEEDIKEILKAGFHAANGLNRQALEFVVIEDRDLMGTYNERIVTPMREMAKTPGILDPIIEAMLADPALDIFYGAPALIFVFAGSRAITPVEDGSLAVGNMMLAAHSMGYGTCFIGFAAGLALDPGFRADCKVPDDSTYIACMTLGKPEGEAERHPRAEVKILNWIK